MTTENLVKHGFPRPHDMSPTHDSNQVILPGGATKIKNSPYISDWPLDHNALTNILTFSLRQSWLSIVEYCCIVYHVIIFPFATQLGYKPLKGPNVCTTEMSISSIEPKMFLFYTLFTQIRLITIVVVYVQ